MIQEVGTKILFMFIRFVSRFLAVSSPFFAAARLIAGPEVKTFCIVMTDDKKEGCVDVTRHSFSCQKLGTLTRLILDNYFARYSNHIYDHSNSLRKSSLNDILLIESWVRGKRKNAKSIEEAAV